MAKRKIDYIEEYDLILHFLKLKKMDSPYSTKNHNKAVWISDDDILKIHSKITRKGLEMFKETCIDDGIRYWDIGRYLTQKGKPNTVPIYEFLAQGQY